MAEIAEMDAKTRERYSRQILFAEIGEEGQERLRASSAVVVGCGALGTAAANLLVRAGVGRLRIVDRDFVEDSNLQRQTLFEEADARQALPKAVAAERRLRVHQFRRLCGRRGSRPGARQRGITARWLSSPAGRHRQFRDAAAAE